MNKSILALLITTTTFAVSSCTIQPSNNQSQNNQIPQKEIQSTKTLITGNYLGSDYKGNYVWGGAMNLAWTELNENIIKEKSQLKTDNKEVLEMVDKLNNPVFTKNDLDKESYYIKSGYGQKTVDTINKESRKKFPSKSFTDLTLELSPKDIISYAYFLKEVAYDTEFKKRDVLFNNQKVKGFIASNHEQQDTVKIIKYESDDKFIIRLKLKDQSDQLILAKGYDMTHPQTVIDEINQNRNNNHPSIGKNDAFSAPSINLDYKRDYTELIGIPFANNKFQDYTIKQMYEKIKFNMDQAGARVENEGVIGVKTTSARSEIIEKPKNFILDKPYWIIMQRQNSQNPYFLLGINTSELMEKVGGEVPQSNKEVTPENVDVSKANDVPNVSKSTETPIDIGELLQSVDPNTVSEKTTRSDKLTENNPITLGTGYSKTSLYVKNGKLYSFPTNDEEHEVAQWNNDFNVIDTSGYFSMGGKLYFVVDAHKGAIGQVKSNSKIVAYSCVDGLDLDGVFFVSGKKQEIKFLGSKKCSSLDFIDVLHDDSGIFILEIPASGELKYFSGIDGKSLKSISENEVGDIKGNILKRTCGHGGCIYSVVK